MMARIWNSFRLIVCGGMAIFVGATAAPAQQNVPRIVLKSGESAGLMNVFNIVNCRSVATGSPEVEILEGPPEISLTIKEQPIIPRAYNCANPVPGGKLVMTAKEVGQPKEAKLTFRVKYPGKTGERQWGYVYNVSLFPKEPHAGDTAPAGPATNPANLTGPSPH
jgi:hypothetical protein